MIKAFQSIVRRIAFRTGKLHSLYLRVCGPDGDEYARYLKARKRFHSIGENCYVMVNAVFTDPELVEIGNNVQFAGCTVFCHDGSISMLNRAYGKVLDAVGPVRFKDNVFIGHDAVIMPNVTIGPNAIVGAGSLVLRDVPEGKIVSGIPAKVIGSLDTLVAFREQQTQALPWADLLQKRGLRGYDPELEPELMARRIEHFFSQPEPPATEPSAGSVEDAA